MSVAKLRAVSNTGEVPSLFPLEMDLPEFRQRVNRWANAHDPRYRTLLYVIGNLVDRETGVAKIGQEKIAERFQEALDRQRNNEIGPTAKTIGRMVSELQEFGVMERFQPFTKQGWSNKTLYRTNRYTPNFEMVIQDGQPVPHNFMEPLTYEEATQSINLSSGKGDGMSYGMSSRKGDSSVFSLSSSVPSRSNSKRVYGSRASRQEGEAPDYLPDGVAAIEDLAAYLEEEFGSEVTRTTLSKKLWPVRGAWSPSLLLQAAEAFLDERAEFIDPDYNPIGYFMQVFPEWLQEQE